MKSSFDELKDRTPILTPPKVSLRQKFRLYKFYIIFAIAMASLAIYIFVLIFGNKSILVLMELREQESALQESVKFYQKQNAYLQKEIFEIGGE